MVILSGCSTTNISQVEAKLQKSDTYAIRDSLQKGDTTTYYYYAFYGRREVFGVVGQGMIVTTS